MLRPNLEFVALPVPEIIGSTQKNLGSPWIRPRSIFSNFFHGFVFGWTRPVNVSVRFAVCIALAVPEIIAIAVLGWDCEPPMLGKGRPYGVGDGTVRKSVGDFL